MLATSPTMTPRTKLPYVLCNYVLSYLVILYHNSFLCILKIVSMVLCDIYGNDLRQIHLLIIGAPHGINSSLINCLVLDGVLATLFNEKYSHVAIILLL